MPPGDAQRVWFPEMLKELERTWSSSMPWDALADFCRRMTAERRAIREARGIQPPRFRCPRCGSVGRADISGVSVRSALFALKKLGLISDGELRALDRSWKRHRASHRLDPYGDAIATSRDNREPHSGCS